MAKSVFSSEPHLWLEEHFWFEEEQTAVSRYVVVDDDISVYTNTLLAYGNHDYVKLLQENGARHIRRQPSLSDDPNFSYLVAGT